MSLWQTDVYVRMTFYSGHMLVQLAVQLYFYMTGTTCGSYMPLWQEWHASVQD